MNSELQHNYQNLCVILCSNEGNPSGMEIVSSQWNSLVALARSEGVAPLLYARMKDGSSESNIPEECLETLKAEYYRTAAQNALLFVELNRFLTAFQSANIPTVVLKGLDLAQTLYGNPALRPMGDIDVLIPERCLEQAISIVEDLGYEPEEAWAMPEIRSGLKRLLFFEANFDGGKNANVHFELHWSLVAPRGNRYSPDIEWFWKGTRQASLNGLPALVLTPTRNVLFLAGHLMLKHIAFKHGEDRTCLRWYYDLHLLIEQNYDVIDWDEIVAQANRTRWQTVLLLALQAVKSRFNTRLPDGLLGDLASFSDRKLMRQLDNGQVRNSTRFSTSMEDFGNMYWQTRFWLLWGLIFPEKEYMIWRYKPDPTWLWPLCFFYRWFDIISDGTRTVIQRLISE